LRFEPVPESFLTKIIGRLGKYLGGDNRNGQRKKKGKIKLSKLFPETVARLDEEVNRKYGGEITKGGRVLG